MSPSHKSLLFCSRGWLFLSTEGLLPKRILGYKLPPSLEAIRNSHSGKRSPVQLRSLFPSGLRACFLPYVIPAGSSLPALFALTLKLPRCSSFSCPPHAGSGLGGWPGAGWEERTEECNFPVSLGHDVALGMMQLVEGKLALGVKVEFKPRGSAMGKVCWEPGEVRKDGRSGDRL